MKTLAPVIMLIALCWIPPTEMAAQEDYRFDAGGGIGMTGYLGDANSSNLWSHPGFDGMLLFRYLRSPRIAFKTGLYAGTLSGNTEDMSDVLPDSHQFKFSTTFFELSEMFEFNFFNYGIGEKYRMLKRWSPYITAGVGATIWMTDGYTGGAFTLPLGLGVKYKLNERLNLGLEFLMKKVFSDSVDGKDLADPHAIKSGFAKNTDWYSTLSVTLSYEFSKRCATCNYKE
ncbi:MAG: porin family protein [Muribaculaceae bacterium]|nr:porin family protein [Muribaculaceae bacterium]